MGFLTYEKSGIPLSFLLMFIEVCIEKANDRSHRLTDRRFRWAGQKYRQSSGNRRFLLIFSQISSGWPRATAPFCMLSHEELGGSSAARRVLRF